jgi:hypothetical protein
MAGGGGDMEGVAVVVVVEAERDARRRRRVERVALPAGMVLAQPCRCSRW